MFKEIIIWGFETLPVEVRESWIARMVDENNNIDSQVLAELIDVCLGKLKRIMDTRHVRILKPEGLAVLKELEKLVASSGKDLVASMSTEEISELYLGLQEKADEEDDKPRMLN